jgi:hypothetical protein
MNNNNDDVQDLIIQLRSLQLRQTDLIGRLERARRRESRANATSENAVLSTYETREETRRSSVDNDETTHGFALGDRVRITNPSRFQSNRGTVVKIGPKRITVETRSGSKILRAPKNLIIDHE